MDNSTKRLNSFAQIEFGIHLGKEIRDLINRKNLKQTDLCRQLNITTQGVQGKLNTPVYGNIYDLIRTSEFLGMDLFNFLRNLLTTNGYTLFQGNDEKYQQENELLKAKIEKQKKEIELLENLSRLRESN